MYEIGTRVQVIEDPLLIGFIGSRPPRGTIFYTVIMEHNGARYSYTEDQIQIIQDVASKKFYVGKNIKIKKTGRKGIIIDIIGKDILYIQTGEFTKRYFKKNEVKLE